MRSIPTAPLPEIAPRIEIPLQRSTTSSLPFDGLPLEGLFDVRAELDKVLPTLPSKRVNAAKTVVAVYGGVEARLRASKC